MSLLERWSERRRLRELVRASERRTLLGIDVLLTNPGTFGTNDELFAKVEAALGLIAAHQPWRMRRVRRDVRLVWLKRQPSFRASYRYETGACMLDTYFVSKFTPEEIAASIVHEAVHARVGRLDVERDRVREERLCRRAEVSLGRALPGGEVVLARALRALSAADHEVAPAVDWAEVERVRRAVERNER